MSSEPKNRPLWLMSGTSRELRSHPRVADGVRRKGRQGIPRDTTTTHLSDGLAGRWDRFSWYGIRGVLKTGKLGAEITTKNTSSSDLVQTFESLLIAVTAPPQNKRGEALLGARLILQAGAERPRPAASYLDELRIGVSDIRARLASIEQKLA